MTKADKTPHPTGYLAQWYLMFKIFPWEQGWVKAEAELSPHCPPRVTHRHLGQAQPFRTNTQPQHCYLG